MVSKTTLWRQANPDKARQLRLKEKPRTPEQAASAYRRRKDRDPEGWSKKRRAQYSRNPEAFRKASLRWAKNHPEKNAELSRRRYAKLKGVEIGPIDLDNVWHRQHGWCPLCLHSLDREEAHLDHIKPISKGGSHTQDNVQFVHPICNIKKGNKYAEPIASRAVSRGGNK